MHPTANIIAKFGAAIGIDGLETENGVCTLQFDDVTATLECAENGDALYLYSRVCGLPDNDADKLALYGLQAAYPACCWNWTAFSRARTAGCWASSPCSTL